MSILTYTPKPFETKQQLIKCMSIKHKNFDADVLKIKTSFKGVCVELSFRNNYKHRHLTCTIFGDGFTNELRHHKTSYITGHDFIFFSNRVLNYIESIVK